MKKKGATKELKIPIWIADGFVGVLALVIYNFLLYLLDASEVWQALRQMEDAMGYFGLNTFIDLQFSAAGMTLGLIVMFLIAFLIGMFVANRVRAKKKYQNKATF